MTVRRVRPGIHDAPDAGAVVDAGEEARVVAAEGHVRRVGERLDVPRFSRHIVPLRPVDPAGPAARPAYAGVVLLSAAHVIGEVVRGGDVVELRRREILIGPGFRAVGRDRRAAVVPQDHALRIVGRDPQGVRVAVQHVDLPERATPVPRPVEDHVGRVHGVGVLGVGGELHVVPGAHAQLVVVVDPRPRRAAVVGAVHPARIGLDERPHSGRFRRRDGEPDVAQQPARQAGVARQLGPVRAAVGGLEDPAPYAPRDELPGEALRLPERGVQHLGIRGIHREVGGAGGIVAEQDLGPRFAAVAGLVDPALGVRSERASLRGHVHDVGVRGMDPHARDLLGLGEAEGGPRPAGVSGLEHAVAVGDVAADRVLARAHVDDVGVRLADADRADRTAEVLVARREPGVAAVGGLEDAAAGGPHPVLVGTRRRTRHGHRPAAAEDADLAPFQGGEHRGVIGSGRLGEERRGEKQGAEEKQAGSGHGDPPG